MVSSRRISRGIPAAGLALAAAALLLSGCDRRPERPNVVLVVLDTVRRDHTICGGSASATPNLDSLAADAAVFTNAWAAAPWTPPSHASMFTGLLPSTHDCRGRQRTLATRWPTLAERLRAAGYETAAFHANPWLTNELTGLMRGFETARIGAAPNMDIYARTAQGGPETVAAVGEWLESRDGGRPFFLFVNFLEAHLPYDPPAAYRQAHLADLPQDDRVAARWANEFNAGLHRDEDVDWERVRRFYRGDVAEADRLLGCLLELLRERGLVEDSVVIVVSDHGENLGDHGWVDHQFGVFETLLAVPLVIRAPGRLEAGERNDPVVLTDLYATVLDATGVTEEPFPETSRSLLGPPAHAERPLVAEYAGPPRILLDRLVELNPAVDLRRLSLAHSTVRVGPLRATVSSDGDVALFDLSLDPAESRNLAREEPGKVSTLVKLIPSVRGGSEADSKIDERLSESLRALGYM
jgi:arylsulfatase A-like enzyme